MGRPKRNNRGFGIIEVLISVALVGVVSVMIFKLITGSLISSIRLSGVSTCQSAVTNIIDNIKSIDNALVVRTWLPSAATPLSTSQSDNDPFCNTVGGRTPVCDRFPLFTNIDSQPYVDPTSYKTYQNIRGSFTWAQTVYNTYRTNGICLDSGMTLSPTALANLLPKSANLQFQSFTNNFKLYIKDAAVACGSSSTSGTTTMEIRVTAEFQCTGPGEQNNSCNAKIDIANAINKSAPTLTVANVRNGFGTAITANRCSDLRTVQQITAAGGPGTEWQNIYMDVQSNEPGVALLCRKDGAAEPPDPAGHFYNCPDMPVQGTLAMTPNSTSMTYNMPMQGQMAMMGMPDTGTQTHHYKIKAVDADGNESAESSATFMVHTPTCPPLNTYCPNAYPDTLPFDYTRTNPAMPPLLSRGIGVVPYDDCGNGHCPEPGTHSFCDPAVAANICVGTNFVDDCGRNVCGGTKGPSCAGIDLSRVPCGQVVTGQCGANCGTGTQPSCAGAPDPSSVAWGQPVPGQCGAVCGIGTAGKKSVGPSSPGCDCASVDLTTMDCDEYAANSCGEPDACGPGFNNCPTCITDPTLPSCLCSDGTPPPCAARPPPDPWTGPRMGPFICAMHGNSRSCSIDPWNAFHMAPPDRSPYQSYSIRLDVYIHRHGRSLVNVNARLMPTVPFNPATYNIGPKHGKDLGPELGGSHPTTQIVPAFPSPYTLTVGGNGVPPTLYIDMSVDDADLQIYWTGSASADAPPASPPTYQDSAPTVDPEYPEEH
ncbi:MAG: type II secretion system protein [Bdellovibrionales bacterium]